MREAKNEMTCFTYYARWRVFAHYVKRVIFHSFIFNLVEFNVFNRRYLE